MTTSHVIISVLILGGIIVAALVALRFRHEFIVNEGLAGLLYHDGKLTGALGAGRYVRWGRNYRIAHVDTRKTVLQVAGQEVLSADNVGVKLSIVLTTQIVDAIRATQEVDSHLTHLHSATQTAVRTVVAGVAMDALLGQRVAIGAQIRELVAPQASAIGVQVHTVEVRDVMLPGELRKAFNEVLKAKQDGQAALERARAESAALRNLANAARLIEGQPARATLRFFQTLEASEANRTFVMNDISGLLPVLNSRGAKPSTSQPDET